MVASQLQCRYDLGEGDKLLTLPYVNVSDGVWHTVVIHRYGNHIMLWLDGGESIYQTEIWPYDGFRHLIIAARGTYGAASVWRNHYSQEVTTTMVLANSKYTHTHTHTYIYIYIYIYTHTLSRARGPHARIHTTFWSYVK